MSATASRGTMAERLVAAVGAVADQRLDMLEEHTVAENPRADQPVLAVHAIERGVRQEGQQVQRGQRGGQVVLAITGATTE